MKKLMERVARLVGATCLIIFVSLTAGAQSDFNLEIDEDLEIDMEGVAYPHLTSTTMFLQLPDAGNTATLANPSEGIFGISMHKNLLDDHLYEFWTIDGKKLFEAEWEDLLYQNRSPEFHDGVVAMRKTSGSTGKRQPVYLLYSDGRSKALPGSNGWMGVTNFCDGLALAMSDIATNRSFYINKAGEKVFPHLVMHGMPQEGIRPLRDGLRAFRADWAKWGYIDAAGAIKFPAVFKEAGDFSEGYAWVVKDDDKKHLIDKTGKTIFSFDRRNIRTSEVVDGIFYAVESGSPYVTYYDISGKKLAEVRAGNRFCEGYAYIYNPESEWDSDAVIEIVDKEFETVSVLPEEIIESSEVMEYRPVFNSKGYAPVYSGRIYQGSSIVRPDGRIALRRYSSARSGSSCNTFGPVSADGFFKSEIRFGDLQGVAIVNLKGEVVWVLSDSAVMAGPWPADEVDFPVAGESSADMITLKKMN